METGILENIASTSHSLAGSDDLKRDINRPRYYGDIFQFAVERDFDPLDDPITTKKGLWHVYQRPNHAIHNFPEGEVNTHSMLAIYDRYGKEGRAESQVVLRYASEPFQVDQFEKDLDAMSRHYIERQWVFGFPSKLTSAFYFPHVATLIGMFAGLSAGVAYNHYETGSPTLYPEGVVGLLSGFFLGMVGGIISQPLSERRASRSISSLDEYWTGVQAVDVLYREQNHVNTVAVQRELYAALNEEQYNLSPEEFLAQVYQQMPKNLVRERMGEIEKAKQGLLEGLDETSLDKIVRVSHVLLESSPQLA